MKCVECEKNEAEWILVDHEHVKPLCKACLDNFIDMEGEMNLNFYLIANGLEPVFEEINKNLKYCWDKYGRLLQECISLKKRVERND